MDEIARAPIVRVGVDLAKQVIQVHAMDASGRRVAARAFKRDQFFAWCAQLPAACMGGDGGVLERAPLGA
jgi:transposase